MQNAGRVWETRLMVLLTVICIGLGLPVTVNSDESSHSVRVGLFPVASVPLGEYASLYSISGGGEISLNFSPAGISPFFLETSVANMYSFTEADKALNTVSLGAGGGVTYPLFPWLDFSLFARGAYSYGVIETFAGDRATGGGTALFGGIRADTSLSPGLTLSLNTGYRYEPGLFEGLHGGVGLLWELGSRKAGPVRLEFQNSDIGRVFPVFYKYYDVNSLGTVTIINGEPGKIEDLRVSFYVDQFMERPKLSSEVDQLEKGESVEIPLYALFRDDILSIVEQTAVSGEITATYSYRGVEKTASISRTISIIDRNGMTWDDDRKAAAFVSSKDPLVIQFARLASGALRRENLIALNDSFRKALALYEVLSAYGLDYVVDPQTPYEQLYQNKDAVDYLQFPRQTIQYRSGDCDDLSILYASLLESLGISSAFITVPGHIYVAFDIGVPPDEAARIFSQPEALIVYDERAWLPVEITMVGQPFSEAWEYGASEWNSHFPNGKANFVEVSDAWSVYEPVGFTLDENLSGAIQFPGEAEAGNRVADSFSAVVERELSAWEQKIRSAYSDPDSPAALNKLGTTYARFGRLEEAERRFRRILEEDTRYFPAYVNLGNIAFLGENYGDALQYFTQAYLMKPNNKSVLISLAKVHYELENSAIASQYYEQAVDIDRSLEKRFAYLQSDRQSGQRASSPEKRKEMLWTEED